MMCVEEGWLAPQESNHARNIHEPTPLEKEMCYTSLAANAPLDPSAAASWGPAKEQGGENSWGCSTLIRIAVVLTSFFHS